VPSATFLLGTLGMALAVILSFCMFCLGSAAAPIPAEMQSSQQPATETKPAESPTQSPQSNSDVHSGVRSGVQTDTQPAPQPAAPAAQQPSASSATKSPPAAAKYKHQYKAKRPAPCNASAGSKPASTVAPDPATAGGSAPAGGSAKADLPPCPPPKIVVRNGGTSEGAVQLSGGSSAGKESPRRAGTEKLLGSTEEDLKRIEVLALNSSQQETVKQIHHYMAQSKSALAAGDLDLAHNLAMKAHLLADELLQPRM
jgi:hypothetical protein